MKKIQVVEFLENNQVALSKARNDISEVAEQMGYQRFEFRQPVQGKALSKKLNRQISYTYNWLKLFASVKQGDLVLIQNPLSHHVMLRGFLLKQMKKKGIHFISIIHDIECLRKIYDKPYYQEEYKVMMETEPVIIAQNQRMCQYFINQNVNKKHLVSLQIFDYIQQEKEDPQIRFEPVVTIAGNLDVRKCAYLKNISKLEDVSFCLYGPNYDPSAIDGANISYKGTFPAEKLKEEIHSGFGLVWDGESIDTCSGPTGEYLRFNSPHKLSLFLSVGVPVIIWEEAAEAKLVKENGLGITVSSLKELSHILGSITEEEFYGYCNAVKKIRSKIIDGYYAKTAIGEAEQAIWGKN